MRKFLTLITIAAMGSIMAGCVVEPVDGVSVGYGQGVVLHHGGDAPGAVVAVPAQPPVVAQPVIVEHEHHEHWHDDDRY